MPAGVVGAALTFSGSFLVTSAIQMIASRMLDSRKVFVLGISFALGIAALMYPDHFRAAPPWLVPFVGSPLSISVMTAVLLRRSDARRVGKECGSTCRSRGSPSP